MNQGDRSRSWCVLAFTVVATSAAVGVGAPPVRTAVRVERLPDNGIQPQVAVGSDGTVHLVYFRGEPAAGDLYYCRRGQGESDFSAPIRVNNEPASAIATGTIRGAQLALGKDNRAHVAWNGSNRARPRGPNDETPLLYTRLGDDGTQFEPERNLITAAYGLDGGACIAADADGHVFVAWHAGDGGGESSRRVWLRRSDDDGLTFDEERPIDGEQVGACGCCGMRGTVSPTGEVLFLYRAAREESHRDMYVLTSKDSGDTFNSRKLHPWELNACPMSSEAFAHSADTTWGAWETAEQVYFAELGGASNRRVSHRPAPGKAAKRKHPALAGNDQGQLLLVWTEGTGWNKGGGLAWQVFDAEGRPARDKGQAPGVPVWSFAVTYADPDGGFVILY